MKKSIKGNLANIIFIAAFLIISLVPAVFFSGRQQPIGNEVKAPKPELSDGTDFFARADKYFAQNFGMRNRLVDAGNRLKQAVFKTSGQKEVIIGEEGWLFYESALKDYTGTDRLTDGQLDKAAMVVKLMQSYVESQGKDFIFFIAPNKMSVYGEYMPYYYTESTIDSDYDRLYDSFRAYGVNTINLKNIFQSKKLLGVQLYHKLDSHWNNYGAALAYETAMDKLDELYGDYPIDKYTDMDYRIIQSHKGDLQGMLLPYSRHKDEQVQFEADERFEYITRFKDVDDLLITTENKEPAVDKNAVLYRDSFGNALYWFFANDFAGFNAKRELPYNLYDAIDENELIAVELVERNIKNLLIYTPVIVSDNKGSEVIEEMEINKDIDKNSEVSANIAKLPDGLTELDFICEKDSEMLKNVSEIYLILQNEKETASYQLIPTMEDGEYLLYITEDEKNRFVENYIRIMENAEGSIYFVYKNNECYDKMSLNVTLQD